MKNKSKKERSEVKESVSLVYWLPLLFLFFLFSFDIGYSLKNVFILVVYIDLLRKYQKGIISTYLIFFLLRFSFNRIAQIIKLIAAICNNFSLYLYISIIYIFCINQFVLLKWSTWWFYVKILVWLTAFLLYYTRC